MISSTTVNELYLEVKFDRTPRTSTITNDKFTLTSLGATPAVVSNPFKTIDLHHHYDSIARTLTLWFVTPLAVGSYRLDVAGILDAAGKTLTPYTTDFTVTTPPSTITPAPDPVVEIEDHSIKVDAFVLSKSIIAANPSFNIVKTSPNNQELFVTDADLTRGRLIITFSQMPDLDFINAAYIKVQRKLLGLTAARWETIDVRFARDSYYPKVYIYLPSQDATPVYNEVGKIYLVDGYKYRVRISNEVGT